MYGVESRWYAVMINEEARAQAYARALHYIQ